jgi:aspartate aminotransferase-like enzyme
METRLVNVPEPGELPVEADAWRTGAVSSGAQVRLSCLPGLAPVTRSPQAPEALRACRARARSWHLDASMIADHRAERERACRRARPLSMIHGLREWPGIDLEDGLPRRFAPTAATLRR